MDTFLITASQCQAILERLDKPEEIIIIIIIIVVVIIKYIYIAQVHRRKCCKCTGVHSCMSNRKVFSLFLNVSITMSGSRSSAGRLFPTRGP